MPRIRLPGLATVNTMPNDNSNGNKAADAAVTGVTLLTGTVGAAVGGVSRIGECHESFRHIESLLSYGRGCRFQVLRRNQ